MTLARSVSNRFIEGVSLASLAALHCKTGAHTASFTTFRDAIEHWLDAADQSHQLTTLRNLTVLFRSLELPAETAHLLRGLNACGATTYGSELADQTSIERWLDDTLPPGSPSDHRTDEHVPGGTELARWALDTIDRQLTS